MKKIIRLTTFVSFLILPVITNAGTEIRDYYSEPGINPYKSHSDHPNESISTFNGSLSLSHTDIFLPGEGGLDIKINRYYSGAASSSSRISPYGHGWTMHFGRIAVPGSGVSSSIYSKLCQNKLSSDSLNQCR